MRSIFAIFCNNVGTTTNVCADEGMPFEKFNLGNRLGFASIVLIQLTKVVANCVLANANSRLISANSSIAIPLR